MKTVKYRCAEDRDAKLIVEDYESNTTWFTVIEGPLESVTAVLTPRQLRHLRGVIAARLQELGESEEPSEEVIEP